MFVFVNFSNFKFIISMLSTSLLGSENQQDVLRKREETLATDGKCAKNDAHMYFLMWFHHRIISEHVFLHLR